MARSAIREMSMEEYDAWSAAVDRTEGVAEAADEEGGPRVSLVPKPEQNIAWPTDLLAPAADPSVEAMPFDDVPLESSRNRLAGWSAERQRLFLNEFAQTGSVHFAANAARLSARSAYLLRTRSPAFARCWNAAPQLAVGRLSALAFDRAVNRRVEQVYREGNLIAERRLPSDKLLMWLLARLDPKRFAAPWEQRGDADPQADAVAAFPALLDELSDATA